MPWLKRLFAGLSPQRPRFTPASVHVGFVVDKVATLQVSLRVLRFSLSVPFLLCSILIYLGLVGAAVQRHSLNPST
jgi:hypothetical protein